MKNKLILVPLGLILIIGIIAFQRFRSSEDSWVCEDGTWVKHGNPSSPMPSYACSDGDEVLDSEAGVANPAAKNCLDKGGELKQLEETAGTLGICHFPDGSECEEWQFFRGECLKGQYQDADTSHPYEGTVSQKGKDFVFKTLGGAEYLLSADGLSGELKNRLVVEARDQETVTIIAAETPPLSKTLILKSFQGK
jgi:putative hemolysin